VAEISDEQHESVVSRLAGHIFEHYGAPDMSAAAEAAPGEARYAAGLCDHPIGTMLGIEREFTDGGVTERIRVIPQQDEAMHAKSGRLWSMRTQGNRKAGDPDRIRTCDLQIKNNKVYPDCFNKDDI